MNILASILVFSSAFSFPASNLEKILDERVLPEGSETLSSQLLLDRVFKADIAADKAWLSLKNKDEYDAYRKALREKYIKAIGGFFEKTPLNAKVAQIIEKPSYKVEKIIFESHPGVYVTANLYLPAAGKFAPPYRAMLISSGHTELGKASRNHTRMAAILANEGIAAFVYDPISQGERFQNPRTTNVWGHYRLGCLSIPLGRSMALFRIWDAVRSMDYLDTRSDIVHGKYAIAGNSGGGTMTSLVMSIDDRIVAAAPSCFITSIRHVYAAKGPQDPEQVIFGQLPIGLNHASFVLAGGNAVRIHAVHEDFFPFAGTLRTYDTVRRVVENCSLDETTYALTDVFGRHNWPESSRQSTANWMKRFLLGDKSVGDVNVEKLRRIDESFNFADHDCGLDRAQCNVTSSGDISKEPGFRSVFEILYDEYLKSRRNATPLKGAELKKTADRLAGIVQPENSGFTVIEKSSFKTNGCLVAKLSFENAEGVKLPAVLIRPPKEVSAPVVFAGAKTRGSFAKEISAALAEGRCVLSVDLFGIGEIGTPKVPYFASKIGRGPEEGVAAHLYAFGESLIGYWASEMLFAGDYLKKLTGKVPRVHSVGTGVIAAAHAYASRRDLVSAVTWSGEKPYSWESMVKVASMDCGYANTVFGALKYYDWTDLL